MDANVHEPVPTDRDMLDRYLRGDPAAIAGIFERYGRMMYGVCCRILGNASDAEDAFQAALLVAMRKARTIRARESIGGWLHTVVTRVALRSRKRRATAKQREQEALAVRNQLGFSSGADAPWAGDLDAALADLPERHRLPLTLCYLNGKTGDEAAAELGWSRSTLTRRLTEAREAMRRRLESLGYAVPAVALVAVLEGLATAAEPPTAAAACVAKLAAGTPLADAGFNPAALSLAEAGAKTAGVGVAVKVAAAVLALLAICGVGLIAILGSGERTEPVAVVALAPEAEEKPILATTDKPKADPVAITPVAVVPAPNPPALKDEQKIGMWKGHNFHWEPADANQLRPVSFAVTVPPGHKFVTVAVDDTNGVRVRNLLDAVEVAKLGGKLDATESQVLSVEWNGLDDRGRPLSDGVYRIRGCSHPGLKCVYEYSFLNPGTPPWEGYPNSGWGGDHGFPHAIACLRGHGVGQWRVAIGGTIGEGGTASFAIDANDRKCKAFNHGWNGAKALAASDGMLWICESGSKYLYRVTYHDSKQIAFKSASGPKPTLGFDVDPWGIALGKTRAAVLLHDEKQPKKERVVIFDKNTGDNRVEIPLTVPGRRNGLAFAADGTTLFVSTNDGMFALITTDAKLVPKSVTFDGIEKPGPLATDKDGNLYVLDRGADYRVKVFSPEQKLLREIGTKGGQGDRLEFDPAALRGVEAISVDDDGNLWVAENGDLDNNPGRGFVRRIAVWDRAGKFVKDFVGTTWYGANNTCLHEQDPTLALGYGVIYKVEPGKKPGYRPWKYLTHGQPIDSPLWHGTGSPGTLFGSVRMFRSNVSGKEREYVLQMNGFPILFQADDAGEYRPILSIGSHEHNKMFPQVKDEPKALFLWTDTNGDAKPQSDEFQRVPGSNYSVHFFMGWGYPPPRDLAWFVEGLELKPVRFTDRSVPVYDVAKASRLATPQLYLQVGKHLMATVPGKWDSPEAGYFFAGNYQFTDLTGKTVATYRCNWPGVHASWQSAIAKPGQTGRTVGELFIAGSADTGGEIGHVVCPQGNQGQSFLLSEDGLFVGTLFKDTRQNPKGWGAKEEFGADWSDITLMSECFGGWFGRQGDGKVRYMFGRNGCHVVRVEGLDAVKRFDAGAVELKGPTAAGKPALKADPVDRVLRVPNVKGRFPAFKVDGDVAEWKDVPRREIKVGDDIVAKVAVAHTLEYLWILAEVEDPSPWKNAGIDAKLAFKTGDAIDINIGPTGIDRGAPIAGDVRILIAPGLKKPVVMAYRPVKPGAKPDEAFKFESPVKAHTFASVVPITDAQVAFKETKTGYVVEVRLSCDQINLKHAESGLRLRGDVGVLWGNDAGMVTERRSYLFNRGPAATVVSDTPTEAELHPAQWGIWVLE